MSNIHLTIAAAYTLDQHQTTNRRLHACSGSAAKSIRLSCRGLILPHYHIDNPPQDTWLSSGICPTRPCPSTPVWGNDVMRFFLIWFEPRAWFSGLLIPHIIQQTIYNILLFHKRPITGRSRISVWANYVDIYRAHRSIAWWSFQKTSDLAALDLTASDLASASPSKRTLGSHMPHAGDAHPSSPRPPSYPKATSKATSTNLNFFKQSKAAFHYVYF